MTEQDRINFDLIDGLVTQVWGFDDASLAYFRKEIRNPTLDPTYQIVGDDYRIRWPINVNDPKLNEKQMENDRGWRIFRDAFRAFCAFNTVGYNNYLTNKMTVGKNEVKLKKVIVDYYVKNVSNFTGYYMSDFASMQEREYTNLAKTNPKSFEAEVEKYVIKAFEYIGKYKTPHSNFELVLSLNFADWFLCSTKQTWSSCLNLEGGGYWRGIASLIGDKNRAFLYIANGKKKNFKGIIVDEVIARTWVLLSEDDKKNLVRFYPNEFLSVDTIKLVTGDNSYQMIDGYKKMSGKREIEPVLFKKGKAFMTIYNDACAIDEGKLAKTKKLYPIIGQKGCFQYLSYGSGVLRAGIDVDGGHTSVDRYIAAGKSISDYITAYMCEECGSPLDRDRGNYMKDRDGNYYCISCGKKVLVMCEHCGNYDRKDRIKEIKLGEKVTKVCSSRCEKETIRCDCCGDLTFKSESKRVNSYDENGQIHSVSVCICNKCYGQHVTRCNYCGEYHFKKQIYTFKKDGNTKLVCRGCFNKKDEHDEFIGYEACEDCRNILPIESLVFDHRERAFCVPCVKKAIDAKQIKFSFIK